MEILAMGDPLSAREALEMGLPNCVVPNEQLMQKALGLAGRLAANGPLAVRKPKEGILRSSGLSLSHAYETENEVSAAVMRWRDAREGARAFKEKRKPRFVGE